MSTSLSILPNSNPRYQILLDMYASVFRAQTPDLVEFIARKPKITQWLGQVIEKIDEQQLTEAELADAAGSYVKGIVKAGGMHAQELWKAFREAKLPIEDLDLRVMRYLPLKLTFVLADSSEYFLFGIPPDPLPGPGVRWATAEDWLTVLSSSGAIRTVQAFGLPLNARHVFAPEPVVIKPPEEQVSLPGLS